MWTVWGERNRRTFEDVAKTESQLFDCFASSLFDWSRALLIVLLFCILIPPCLLFLLILLL